MDFKGFLNRQNLLIALGAVLVVVVFVLMIIFLGGDDNNEPKKNTDVTYEEYEFGMNEEEKLEHYHSFENYQDFFDWYNAAKAEYDEEHKSPVIGEDGVIDIGGSND